MNVSEDELEQRLRTLFSDDRLGVSPPADAAPAIMAGAQRRRQRRKVLMSASGAVCALALVSGGLVVFKFQATTGTADLTASRLTVPNASASPPVAPITSAEPPTSEAPPVAPPAKPTHVSAGPPKRHSPPPSTRGDAPAKVTKGPLLTSDGLESLKLGMTEEQLADQGLTLTPVKESAGCTYYDVAGDGVPAATAVVSPDAGVVVVKPDGAAHTPEGVGEGSAKEDVTAAYPGTSQASDELVAPTGDEGAYHFTLDGDGSVSSLDVRTVNQTCVG